MGINKKNEKHSINSEIFTNENLNSDEKQLENRPIKKERGIIINNVDNENILEKNKRSSFFGYILYLITCEKKNNYYKIYSNFREKIISEEYMIKNHLKVYNLLKNS